MKTAALSLALLLIALPAAAQDERRWTFTETEEGVHLQYGTPESDDVLAAFVCNKGSDQAELYLTVEHRIAGEAPTEDGQWLDPEGRPAPWTVTLTLAGYRVEAQATADEMNGGSTLNYLARTGSPPYAAMAQSGELRAEAFGETIAPPPFRKAEMRRFLAACRGD
jgi:hypothetical protein